MNKQSLKDKIIETLTRDFIRIYGIPPSPIIVDNISSIIESEVKE
jgi:hypothetical protein